MLFGSTGLRNSLLPFIREMYNRGCAKLMIYSGAIPASADAAVTGTLLNTITGGGASAKVKQKIRFTPSVGDGAANDWTITLNGVSFKFVDSGALTAAQICTGLYNLILAGNGTAITTPAGTITIPDVNAKFTLTDNTGTLDIEAAVAGVAFDYSATVSGAGTGSWTTTVMAADAFGLQFEAIADISAGIIEKLASQDWKGTNVASGAATHWRLVLDGDTGTLSTSEVRIQGQINTAGSDVNRPSGVQLVEDDIEFFSTFPLAFPANA